MQVNTHSRQSEISWLHLMRSSAGDVTLDTGPFGEQ